MTADERGRHARHIEGLLQDVQDQGGGSHSPSSEEALGELIEALTALSCGDLNAGAQATSAPAKAVNAASEALAERLRPVCDAAKEAKEASRIALGSLLALSDDDEGDQSPDRSPRRDELAGHLDISKTRMTELAHLATRLGEIGGQAQVAALNVAIEVSRDGAANQDTLTTFADEVRRFAERIEAVAQRVIVVVQKAQAAQGGVLDAIDDMSKSEEATIRSARRLTRALDGLAQQLEERFSLPSIGRRNRRVVELRERLDVELRRLAYGDESSQEIDDALDQLDGLLSGPLGHSAPAQTSEEDGSA